MITLDCKYNNWFRAIRIKFPQFVLRGKPPFLLLKLCLREPKNNLMTAQDRGAVANSLFSGTRASEKLNCILNQENNVLTLSPKHPFPFAH